MQWSDIPRDPSPGTLRQFAAIFVVVFGGSALWQWLARDRPVIAVGLGLPAVIVGLTGLARPRALRAFFVGWMVLGFPVGWVTSRLLLAALYYTVFTPAGLVSRGLGRDPLGLRPTPERTTYWSSRPTDIEPSRYLRES